MSNNQLSDTFLSDAHLADYAAIAPKPDIRSTPKCAWRY